MRTITVLYLIFLVAPIALLLLGSFGEVWSNTLLPHGFTLRWYRDIANDPSFVRAFTTSLQAVTLTCLLNLMVGLPLAYAIHTASHRGVRFAARLAAVMPVAAPELVLAFGFILVFSSDTLPWLGSFWLLIADLPGGSSASLLWRDRVCLRSNSRASDLGDTGILGKLPGRTLFIFWEVPLMLKLENVSFNFPGTTVGVRDVSLEVGPGELVAVIGASGSGKTTLLNLLAGFLIPDRGQVLIDGKTVSTIPPEKRHLGIVFQSYGLFPHMRAWENVAYPLKVRGMALDDRRSRAIEALGRVGMGNRVESGPRELSGGQQQRVALARALVFQPKGLLLDEPLSALDANLRVEMRDEILRVQRAAGIATLLVTHDQEEALSIADRVAVMREGELVQIAPPRELYDAPADEETARFVGEANLWLGTVASKGSVRTPVGSLDCDTTGHGIGAAVVVLVRPENVVPLVSSDRSARNTFTGPISADRFLGSVRRLDFAVGDGTIRLETRIRDSVVGVVIPPDAIRLLLPTSKT